MSLARVSYHQTREDNQEHEQYPVIFEGGISMNSNSKRSNPLLRQDFLFVSLWYVVRILFHFMANSFYVSRYILGYSSRFHYDSFEKSLVLFLPPSILLPCPPPIYPFLFHNSLITLCTNAFSLLSLLKISLC